MPISADTLLRLLRPARGTDTTRRSRGRHRRLRLVEGQRYGTICDLEHRHTINPLPGRECGTVANWLAAHPDVEIVCRDRCSG